MAHSLQNHTFIRAKFPFDQTKNFKFILVAFHVFRAYEQQAVFGSSNNGDRAKEGQQGLDLEENSDRWQRQKHEKRAAA